METYEDLYKILGVSEKADFIEIKDAYRRLSKIYHPDVGGDLQSMARLNYAYSILSDSVKRKSYNINRKKRENPKNNHTNNENKTIYVNILDTQQGYYQAEKNSRNFDFNYKPFLDEDGQLYIYYDHIHTAKVIMRNQWLELYRNYLYVINKKKKKEKIVTIIKGSFILAPIIALIVFYIYQSDNSTDNYTVSNETSMSSSLHSTAPTIDLSTIKPTQKIITSTAKSIKIPANGTVMHDYSNSKSAPLEIKTQGSLYHFVKLYDASNNSLKQTVFIYPGKTIEIDVPVGSYIIKYASGDTWYDNQTFGSSGSYAKADDIFRFYIDYEKGIAHGNSITLYTVYSGNLETSSIDMDDF